jgi:hypothetical protein
VQVTDSEVVPTLVRAVVSAGGRVYGVHDRHHDLEDVYFALERDETPTSEEAESHA